MSELKQDDIVSGGDGAVGRVIKVVRHAMPVGHEVKEEIYVDWSLTLLGRAS